MTTMGDISRRVAGARRSALTCPHCGGPLIKRSTRLVAQLKILSPETLVVLGGPEVSYETAGQRITGLADYVITGWGGNETTCSRRSIRSRMRSMNGTRNASPGVRVRW